MTARTTSEMSQDLVRGQSVDEICSSQRGYLAALLQNTISSRSVPTTVHKIIYIKIYIKI